MKIIVYKITNEENNKVYIGQTTRSLKKRLYDHITKSNNGMQRKFHKAISDIGKEKFKISQICECTNNEIANILELYFIKKYNSIIEGYNTNMQSIISDSNRGIKNGMYGKIGKKSIIARPIIAIKYDDTISEWDSMNLFCNENKECDVRNVQAVAAGKRSICSNYCFFYSEEYTEEKLIEKRSKSAFSRRVTLLDKDNNLIKHFKNLDEAALETNISKHAISYRIKNKNKNENESYFVYDFKIFK